MLNASPNPIARAHELFHKGDFDGAIRACRTLLKTRPNHPDVLHRLALAEAQKGEHGAAVRDIKKAIGLRPNSAVFLVDLGQILVAAQRYDEAESAYDRALAADPDFAFTHGVRAELFLITGEFEKAKAAVEQGLAGRSTDLRVALAFAKLAPRLEAEHRAIELLEAQLARTGHSTGARMTLLFHLADQHDRLGEHDRAFELYRQANDLSQMRFFPEHHHAAIDRMIDAWNSEWLSTAPRSGQRGDLALFIVGMPRSGTSLVEQILACHPKVRGAGELTAMPKICAALGGTDPMVQVPMLLEPATVTKAALERQARGYLGTLHALGHGASRVTDKLPINFLHLGLIQLMLPGARVIHCTRDPLDSCLSCYFQHFFSAFPWAYKLGWLGAYYREYERLMEHWRRVLTDLPILDVPYESLVNDQEGWSRRIVEFAGLEWDDACLRFHESPRVTATLSNEQVRRPMYQSSVGRHRHYDRHLAPLRQALGLSEE